MSDKFSSDTPLAARRPVSPHLQIYRPMLTTVMSIVHRITGIGLYFGMALFAWWLYAAASGADYYSSMQAFWGSWFGLLILFGFTWALIHHMLSGLRHFIWDAGHGFDLDKVELMTKATLFGSIGLTVIIWIIGLAVGG